MKHFKPPGKLLGITGISTVLTLFHVCLLSSFLSLGYEYLCAHMHTHTCVHAHTYMHTQAYYTQTSIPMCVLYIYVIHTHICTYTYIYTHIHTSLYTHTHAHTPTLLLGSLSNIALRLEQEIAQTKSKYTLQNVKKCYCAQKEEIRMDWNIWGSQSLSSQR